ncbi:DUF881 domain-containing protein [Nocardioides ferulae]|uniref:DUF881 domain-containing protein n=1 Tax=Nocardioides ferulae TaxID=2340821 RepID=UPI000EB24D00|nr:DUF881 domain-containing protein [Nocardioides ferulae]
MATGSHARPAHEEETPSPRAGWRARLPRRAQHDPQGSEQRDSGRRRGLWRVGTPLVAIGSGALFAVSAANSDGTDLRPGRYTDLASLVSSEAEQYDRLEERVRDLNEEVDELSAEVNERDVNRLRAQAARLSDPAGLEPRSGTGVRVTLSDAPEEVQDSSTQDPRLLVVHQQDIQAVVNALWEGGATAITIQGQRVITTTGIKCEGNAILLQGRPYPQPYVIEAVGDPATMVSALVTDEFVATYREQSEVPDVAVGWGLETLAEVEAPAYEGLLDLSYAEPLR